MGCQIAVAKLYSLKNTTTVKGIIHKCKEINDAGRASRNNSTVAAEIFFVFSGGSLDVILFSVSVVDVAPLYALLV
jgi:tRNA A37 threonylcarbamoyladenosine synthetase subunit TsaC/SUA5/YrdC